jgi:hypothetical protein
MSRNRWLPALLAAATFVAGCSAGSGPTAPPLAQSGVSDSSQAPQRLKTTRPTAATIKQIHAATTGPSSSATWQYLEPLYISNSGTFSVAQKSNTCAPMDPIFGVWYIALGSFSLAQNSSTLPSCTTSNTPPYQGWAKKRSAGTGFKLAVPAPPPYNNLYIVELSLVGFDVNVTPIAGPAVVNGSTSSYQPLVSNLDFTGGGLYAFFVASYTGPTLAQPDVNCEAGSTTCSLGANPTQGNKLVVVVTDGSGALPNLIVTDSNGTPLKQETISPNCGHCVAVYDETVPAGITGEVTYANGASPFYPNVSEIYELANVTAGRFASANTGLIPSTLASTISGVTNNDLQLCSYIQTGLSTGNVTLAFSNGASEIYDYQSDYDVFGREIATGNASSSCTANNINPAYQAGMAYADYP